MTTNRPLKVFLCHSSADKPAVRELYQKLRAEPWIDPWLDEEELFPGMDWNMEIEKAVEAADAIIVCLSKDSITKEGYVQRELKNVLDYADYKPEGTLYLIPVRLEECEPPRRLRTWQYADYFEGQRERGFQKLLTSLMSVMYSIVPEVDLPKEDDDQKKVTPANLYRRSIHLEYKINADAKVVNNYLLQHYTNISHETKFDKTTLRIDGIQSLNIAKNDVFQYGFIAKGHSSYEIYGFFNFAGVVMNEGPKLEAIPELFVITISQGQKEVSILSFDTDVEHAHMFTTELVRILSKAFSVHIIS